MKRKGIIVVLICAGLVASFFMMRVLEAYVIPKKQVSTTQINSKHVEVKRDKFYLRHFSWSGIFPVYGGFIPDPHFLFHEPVNVTHYLATTFQGKSVRYQLMQVNPYFEDRSSELILAIEIDDSTYEFELDYPSDFYSFGTNDPRSGLLHDGNSLYFVVPYNFQDILLVYEFSYPFDVSNKLSYVTYDLNRRNNTDLFQFTLTQHQVDLLLDHTSSSFYRLYTQHMNEEYAATHFHAEKIDPFQVTSPQAIEIANIPDVKKIAMRPIELENTIVYFKYEHIERLLRHINRYKELREQGITETQHLKATVEDRTPLRIEIITQYNNDYSNRRIGISSNIVPANSESHTEQSFQNSDNYALSDQELDEGYYFVMGFGDFSLRLSYDGVEQLQMYLEGIAE